MSDTNNHNPRTTRPGLRPWWLVLGAVALTAALLWTAFPVWAPAVAERFLPPGWQLGEASLERPGLYRLRADAVTLAGELPGLRASLRAGGVTLTFAGRAIHVDRVEVELRPSPVAATGQAPKSDVPLLSLPRLVLPGDLPPLTIGQLDIRWGTGPDAPHWTLHDLALGGGRGLSLDAALTAGHGLALPLMLQVASDDRRLRIALTPEADTRERREPLLDFRQFERDDGSAEATVMLRLDLDHLDTPLLAAMLPAEYAVPQLRVTGTVALDMELLGGDRLEPLNGRLRLNDVEINDGLRSLHTDLDVRGEWNAAQSEWRSERMALTLDGAWPEISVRLQDTLARSGLHLDVAALPLRLTAALPGPGEAAPVPALVLRVDMEGPRNVTLQGGLATSLAVAPAFRVDAVAKRFLVELEPSDGTPDFHGSADLRVDAGLSRPVTLVDGASRYGASAGTVVFDGEIASEPGRPLQLTGELASATLQDASLSNESLALRLGALGLSGRIAVTDSGVRFDGPVAGTSLVIAPTDEVAANSLMAAESLRLELTAEPGNELSVSGSGQLSGVRLPDLGASLDTIDLEFPALALPGVDGDLNAVSTGFVSEMDTRRIEGVDIAVRGRLSGGRQYAGSGDLLLGYAHALPFGFDADLDSAAVTLDFDQAVLPADGLRAAARPLEMTLPDALRFVDGRVLLDGRITLDMTGAGGQLAVRGEALALAFGESRVEGLEFHSDVSVAEVIAGGGPLALELASLAAGLDLLSLDSTLTFSGLDLGFIDLKAQLLGGTLSTPALRVSDGALLGTEIRWEGFDLGKLLRFVDVGGLEGSGTLDASLPIEPDDDGPSLRNGRFAARGPGHLRYSAGVPATNIGMQALENFQYDSLEGSLDYDSAGDYTISLDLLGQNPDLYGGHPIRFRLNLGGAMPALFRSLFLTGDFEQGIIERLRAGEAPVEAAPDTDGPR